MKKDKFTYTDPSQIQIQPKKPQEHAEAPAASGFTAQERADMESAERKKKAAPGKYRVLLVDRFEFFGGAASLGDFSRKAAIALAEKRTDPKAMKQCYVYTQTGRCVWPEKK